MRMKSAGISIAAPPAPTPTTILQIPDPDKLAAAAAATALALGSDIAEIATNSQTEEAARAASSDVAQDVQSS
jgi:hypothetical protein